MGLGLSEKFQGFFLAALPAEKPGVEEGGISQAGFFVDQLLEECQGLLWFAGGRRDDACIVHWAGQCRVKQKGLVKPCKGVGVLFSRQLDIALDLEGPGIFRFSLLDTLHMFKGQVVLSGFVIIIGKGQFGGGEIGVLGQRCNQAFLAQVVLAAGQVRQGQ